MLGKSTLSLNRSGHHRARGWWLGFVIILIGLYTVRFVGQVQTGVTHDDAEYIVLAESFATGQPYRLVNYPNAPLETVWPPGYPLFVLTVPFLVFGPNFALLRIINVVLALATGLTGYWLLRQFMSRSRAILLAGLFLINPQVIKWATIAMSDIPFTLFSVVFWLFYLRWKAHAAPTWRWYGLAIISLAAAVLMRYWGVAFLAAAGIDLLLDRRWRDALLLGLGVGLLVSPFVLFLVAQPETASSSFFAVRSVDRTLPQYLASIGVSLVTYWRTIPIEVVPVLGPMITNALGTVGLAWLVDVAHTLLILVIIIGAWSMTKRSRVPMLIAVCYIGLLIPLTEHLGTETLVFDEPRYLVPVVLFLYAFVAEGISVLAARRRMSDWRRGFFRAATLALILVLVGRNVQQAVAERNFPIGRLDSGKEWIQANTSPEAVFMTTDPVNRYIHIRRHTLDYPATTQDFWAALTEFDVDYLLITHSMRAVHTSWLVGDGLQPDARVESVVMPILERQSQCFNQVYSDAALDTEIYQVNSDCRQYPPE